MRQLTRRLRLLAGFVAIGFGVLFGKSGSWALARYFQIAMPLEVAPLAASVNASVTVVVPAYNAADRIAGLVECLQMQRYPLWRAVIIDDGSTDDTVDVANRLTADDQRFVVVRAAKNCGLPAARNVGIAMCSTEFIMFLDADDFLAPDAIGTRVEMLRADPDAAGSYGHVRSVVDGANWQKIKPRTLDGPANRVSLVSSQGQMPFVVHQVLMRTTAALAIGGFDESFDRGCEDTEFWARSLRSGHEYVDTRAYDCFYVQRVGSMVDSKVADHSDLFSRLLAANLAGESPLPMVETAHKVDGRIGDLVELAAMQRRAFKSLGLMAAAGDAADLPPAVTDALVSDRVISNAAALAEVRNGVSRSLNRAGSANQRLADEGVAAAAFRFRRFLLPTVEPRPLPQAGSPGWAVLVCDAQQQAEIELLIATLPETHVPMLLVGGAISDGTSSEPKFDSKTANWQSVVRYLLLGTMYESVIVPDHHCHAGRLVQAAAAGRGSRVATWSLDPGAGEALSVADLAGYAVASPAGGVDRHTVSSPVLPSATL